MNAITVTVALMLIVTSQTGPIDTSNQCYITYNYDNGIPEPLDLLYDPAQPTISAIIEYEGFTQWFLHCPGYAIRGRQPGGNMVVLHPITNMKLAQ